MLHPDGKSGLLVAWCRLNQEANEVISLHASMFRFGCFSSSVTKAGCGAMASDGALLRAGEE